MVVTDKKERAVAAPSGDSDPRLERQGFTLEAMFRLIERIGTTFEIGKIASLLLMTLMGQLRVKRACVFLPASEKGYLESYRSLGTAGADALSPIAVDSLFVKRLAMTGGPVCLMGDPARGTDAFHELAEARCFVEVGLTHAAVLSEQDTLIGVLLYGDSITGEPLGRFEDEIVRALARVASIAINNAFLYRAMVDARMQLERFAEAKREFISHTSHELRTPLTVLVGALSSLAPRDTDEAMLLDMAREAVARLGKRVEHLLALNNLEFNADAYRFEPCDVSVMIEDILNDLAPALKEKRVRVEIDDGARGSRVPADPEKIEAAIRNVLENATSFVAREGVISVRTGTSEGGPGSDEGVMIKGWGSAAPPPEAHARQYYVLTVQDDGIGIPAEEIASLAEPFVMASNSPNRNVKGLGIGLSLTSRIVAGHGGMLFCRSELDRGARFAIWLPLSERLPHA